jgi:hypothetical protein
MSQLRKDNQAEFDEREYGIKKKTTKNNQFIHYSTVMMSYLH